MWYTDIILLSEVYFQDSFVLMHLLEIKCIDQLLQKESEQVQWSSKQILLEDAQGPTASYCSDNSKWSSNWSGMTHKFF
jgi:hypothetical protein